MKKNLILFVFPALLLAWSCSSQKAVTTPGVAAAPNPEEPQDEFEYRNLDTLVVSAPGITEKTSPDSSFRLPVFNPSHSRANDLLHTRLDLRFDWDKEEVIGKATLRLKPFFYPTGQVVLDAKDFVFHDVRLKGAKEPLPYSYDDRQLTIQLDRTYQRGEEYTLDIEYTAHPSATGGSAAITSDKGLFFIKPEENDPGKPYQIWTQGETEWNSRWFPTIDKPNERCTQEIYLTVEDHFETLSNGVLVSSTPNGDGMRTDYWRMDQPHAPYLFMIAVGDYAIVHDKWGEIPVDYYVEPDFEQDARAIFPHTVEMLQFFSDKLKINYPWPKYAQVVVRDYVLGAMENTTAVVFGEYMQQHRRELIDELSNEKVVAHEMFHHWFGDLVTCESWANLTLNEGFANYSEYLWLEHKYGVDEADFHLLNEWAGYFGESRRKIHPLIDYGYQDKENMFDAHSYNKGGSVLHMLRQYVGDEAFFAALNRYLTTHAYTAVEIHDLRLAFEAVTGEDLLWFFNQWYLQEGHPELTVTYGYDAASGQASVTVEQTQLPADRPAIFQLPAAIDIYLEAGQPPLRKQVRLTERRQTFAFAVPSAPKLILFDADHALLAEVEDNKTEEQLAFQFYHAPKFLDRLQPLQKFEESADPVAAQIMTDALTDPFWYIRGTALSNLKVEEGGGEALRATVRQIAASDPHSQLRALAFRILAEWKDQPSVAIARTAIETDSAYLVVSSGLSLLSDLDPGAALASARLLEKGENTDLLTAIGDIYAKSEDPAYLPFFEKNLDKVEGYEAIDFFVYYLTLADKKGQEGVAAAIEKLKPVATDMNQSPWRRASVMNALSLLRSSLVEKAGEMPENENKSAFETTANYILTEMKKIAAVETNNQLKDIYDQMLSQ